MNQSDKTMNYKLVSIDSKDDLVITDNVVTDEQAMPTL